MKGDRVEVRDFGNFYLNYRSPRQRRNPKTGVVVLVPAKWEWMNMSESGWTKQGGTLSHINACKEYCLSEDEVFSAMKMGKLQYRQNSAHGNPYFKLLRTEVELLALEMHGDKGVKDLAIKHKLRTINSEINSLKRKIGTLEKQKIDLIEIQKQETA